MPNNHETKLISLRLPLTLLARLDEYRKYANQRRANDRLLFDLPELNRSDTIRALLNYAMTNDTNSLDSLTKES